MSPKGNVETKDMFPAPTIYDEPAPKKPDINAKLADLLGVHEGEITIVILERHSNGGIISVRATLNSEREVTDVPSRADVLGQAFLDVRKKSHG